jgi:hypothetical protein
MILNATPVVLVFHWIILAHPDQAARPISGLGYESATLHLAASSPDKHKSKNKHEGCVNCVTLPKPPPIPPPPPPPAPERRLSPRSHLDVPSGFKYAQIVLPTIPPPAPPPTDPGASSTDTGRFSSPSPASRPNAPLVVIPPPPPPPPEPQAPDSSDRSH